MNEDVLIGVPKTERRVFQKLILSVFGDSTSKNHHPGVLWNPFHPSDPRLKAIRMVLGVLGGSLGTLFVSFG